MQAPRRRGVQNRLPFWGRLLKFDWWSLNQTAQSTQEQNMLRKILIPAALAAFLMVATSSQVHAYGAVHAGYTTVGAGGVQHYGTTTASGPYGTATHTSSGSANAYGGERTPARPPPLAPTAARLRPIPLAFTPLPCTTATPRSECLVRPTAHSVSHVGYYDH